MTTTTVTVKVIDGEPMIDSEAMSLLFGVTPELIEAYAAPATVNGQFPIPQAWLKAGRRRASEARAATGCSDLVASLEYWARKDRGADLEIVYEDAR